MNIQKFNLEHKHSDCSLLRSKSHFSLPFCDSEYVACVIPYQKVYDCCVDDNSDIQVCIII